jgi:nicotinate dehydrogenase subunit A
MIRPLLRSTTNPALKKTPGCEVIMSDTQTVQAATVSVNGRRREVRTEPDTALLHVLRNHLGLKGTRFGCGLGLCGTCMVLVDGRAVYSCDTPLWSVAGKEVTTVEGLAAPENPHPLTRALISEQAAQCGFCVSGIIVAAAELLAGNDDPSDAEVRAALDRNLCRCGAHNRIVRAVLAAAAELQASREGTA